MTIVTTFSRQNNAGSRAHYLVSRTSRPRSHPRLRIQRCLLPMLLLYDYHDHHHSHLYCHCILPLPLPLRSTKFFYGYHHLLMTVTAALVTAFITPCRQLQCCCYQCCFHICGTAVSATTAAAAAAAAASVFTATAPQRNLIFSTCRQFSAG